MLSATDPEVLTRLAHVGFGGQERTRYAHLEFFSS